jgi:uncharacterized protein (TIGR03083 family)
MAASLDTVLLAACDAQSDAVGHWLASLTDADLARPSSLAGWRVAELAVHLVQGIALVTDALDAPRPSRGTKALTVAGYTAAFAAAAPEIAAREIAGTKDADAALIRSRWADDLAAMRAAFDRFDGTNPVVAGRRGPIRLNDLLRIRINELVTHSVDAGRPGTDGAPTRGPELMPGAVKATVRMLAEILAERHPGRSVEVRVPPYAAVQIGDGPVHTRGTPPNVFETDAVTFIELATGRTAFAAAFDAGVVRASGSRADLSAYLPVLA